MFPVVIPVAGVGTRSLPASKAVPKEMLPLVNKPIIQYVVEEAVSAGVSEVIFVSSKGKSAIEDHFDKNLELEVLLKERNKTDLLSEVQKLSQLVKVQSVRQKEALGLGHAVGMAEGMITSSHFFVMLGDEVTDAEPNALEQMLKVFQERQKNTPDCGVIMLMKVPDSEVSRYGICELDSKDQGHIKSCVEKPTKDQAPSNWAITGRYLLPKKVFELIRNQKRGALGEIQLTDSLNALAAEGKLFACFFDGKRLDAGDRLGFLEANLHYYLKTNLRPQVLELIESLYKTADKGRDSN